MRVFQGSYADKQSRVHATATWYVEFRDHKETLRRIAGLADRKATLELGRKIERLAWAKGSGETLDPVLTKWVEGLSPRLRTSLQRYGLLDATKVAALEPLAKHVDGESDADGRVTFVGFRQALSAKGTTTKQVDLVAGRAKRVIEGCGFTFWSDISASKVMSHLDGLRADTKDGKGNVTPGIGAQTFNFYLAAFKQFCRWMVRDGRASESPVAYLGGVNVKTDRRHDRRALDVEELRWLLDTTRNGPERYGMSGSERATLYRLAVETGLRAGELASLTRSSFDLDGDRPTVRVAAAYSKHRREDMLPLRPDSAADLRDFLARKLPDALAFNLPKYRPLAEVLRDDLDAARAAWLEEAKPEDRKAHEESRFLCYADSAGRVADFHSLRHTTGSWLAAAGVHPKVAQAVMRHSDINLTMSRYTHVFQGQESDAVAALPDLSAAPSKQSAKATGTDGRPANERQAAGRAAVGNSAQARTLALGNDGRENPSENSARFSAKQGSFSRALTHDAAPEARAPHNEKSPENIGKNQHLQGFSALRPRGLEPLTCGLGNRRSILLSYERPCESSHPILHHPVEAEKLRVYSAEDGPTGRTTRSAQPQAAATTALRRHAPAPLRRTIQGTRSAGASGPRRARAGARTNARRQPRAHHGGGSAVGPVRRAGAGCRRLHPWPRRSRGGVPGSHRPGRKADRAGRRRAAASANGRSAAGGGARHHGAAQQLRRPGQGDGRTGHRGL